jgi:pimeloyl-ACP methyl ester carboxylesterase
MTRNGADEGPPEMITLAYADSTPDLVLLLIHGFPLSSRMWEPQLAELGEHARIIVPDLRGFGDSEPVDGEYTMAELADDCMALLEALGVDGPIVVGGMSMGGYVALELLRQHPDRFAGLLLASTKAGADSAEARAGRDATAARVAQDGIDVVVAGMLGKLMANAVYDEDPELVDEVEEMMRQSSQEGVIGALAAMRDRADSTELLEQIKVPTLVVHGTEDRVIPHAEAEAMAELLPEAGLVLLEGTGHMTPLEQPEAFNAALKDFLVHVAATLEEE